MHPLEEMYEYGRSSMSRNCDLKVRTPTFDVMILKSDLYFSHVSARRSMPDSVKKRTWDVYLILPYLALASPTSQTGRRWTESGKDSTIYWSEKQRLPLAMCAGCRCPPNIYTYFKNNVWTSMKYWKGRGVEGENLRNRRAHAKNIFKYV